MSIEFVSNLSSAFIDYAKLPQEERGNYRISFSTGYLVAYSIFIETLNYFTRDFEVTEQHAIHTLRQFRFRLQQDDSSNLGFIRTSETIRDIFAGITQYFKPQIASHSFFPCNSDWSPEILMPTTIEVFKSIAKYEIKPLNGQEPIEKSIDSLFWNCQLEGMYIQIGRSSLIQPAGNSKNIYQIEVNYSKVDSIDCNTSKIYQLSHIDELSEVCQHIQKDCQAYSDSRISLDARIKRFIHNMGICLAYQTNVQENSDLYNSFVWDRWTLFENNFSVGNGVLHNVEYYHILNRADFKKFKLTIAFSSQTLFHLYRLGYEIAKIRFNGSIAIRETKIEHPFTHVFSSKQELLHWLAVHDSYSRLIELGFSIHIKKNPTEIRVSNRNKMDVFLTSSIDELLKWVSLWSAWHSIKKNTITMPEDPPIGVESPVPHSLTEVVETIISPLKEVYLEELAEAYSKRFSSEIESDKIKSKFLRLIGKKIGILPEDIDDPSSVEIGNHFLDKKILKNDFLQVAHSRLLSDIKERLPLQGWGKEVFAEVIAPKLIRWMCDYPDKAWLPRSSIKIKDDPLFVLLSLQNKINRGDGLSSEEKKWYHEIIGTHVDAADFLDKQLFADDYSKITELGAKNLALSSGFYPWTNIGL